MLDFGAWADEEFALPAEDTALTEEDLEKIVKAQEEKLREE